jgi:N-acetylmuramoyl-L-alanine amidase
MRDRTGESFAGRGPGARDDLSLGQTPGLAAAAEAFAAGRIDRRGLLKFAGASLAMLVSPVGLASSASLLAVRVWPSAEYTRITLEGSSRLRHSHMLVKDPERLVVDLEGVELNSVLQTLPSKISTPTPTSSLIRAGRNKPGVVRLVIELKGEIKPQVFSLEPVGEYGHRLVLDLHPDRTHDP